MKRVAVLVTGHCSQRFRQRFPSLRGDPAKTVETEVIDALAAGRRSTTQPAWSVAWKRRKAAGAGTIRYVWNEAASRCYVVERGRVGLDPIDERWIARTVLGRVETHEQANAIRSGAVVEHTT